MFYAIVLPSSVVLIEKCCCGGGGDGGVGDQVIGWQAKTIEWNESHGEIEDRKNRGFDTNCSRLIWLLLMNSLKHSCKMHVKKCFVCCWCGCCCVFFFLLQHHHSNGDLQLKLNHEAIKSRNFSNRQRLKQTSSRQQLSGLGIYVFMIQIYRCTTYLYFVYVL